MMSYKKIILCCMTVFTLLAGCVNERVYRESEGNVADVTERIAAARHKSDMSGKVTPSLVVNQGMYVDRTPIVISSEPAWLRSHIVIRGEELPFSYYSRTIVSGGGRYILTRYQLGLDTASKISMNYSGSIKGALDLLSAKTGFIYNVRGNNIYWQSFITKTFDVAFMPGATDYQMGKPGAGGGVTSPSSAGGGGQTVNAVLDDSASAQYSNLKGSLSVWRDLEATIRQLMSPDGKVIVSEATTSVTVRDKPANVALISRFIANFNKTLSEQVLVKVQVLDITLQEAFSFGINWEAVKTSFGNKFLLNANYGTPISISSLAPLATTVPFPGTNTFPNTQISNGVANPGLAQAGMLNNGHSTGVTALINALTQQGKVSIVTEPRVVCLNNQVSVIRIVNQEGYLASVQNTTVAGASGGGSAGTITSQLTPGTLITGLTLYVLPKIMGHKIYLQVNADLSNKVSITQASSGGQTIQLPNLTQKQFNQRSVIGSGDTLILSGFRQVGNTANSMQFLDQQLLGGKAAVQNNTETIVLITPIILHGTA